MNPVHYQKQLEAILAKNQKAGVVPALLLHSCCAPCSSYCIEWLSSYFRITVYYYNPNIEPQAEFEKRKNEQKRLIEAMPTVHPVAFLEGAWDPQVFHRAVHGLEACPEGGERCFVCYRLRMLAAARQAQALGMDYFCTTLSISPLKNAQKINAIGQEIQQETGVLWLPSDFKKKEGFKRSIELSRQYGLYRQDYCGCVYSKRQTANQKGDTR